VVMDDFREASALIQVADETGLHSSIRALLSDAQLRGDYGGRAASLVEAKSGALAETVELIIPHLLKS